MRAADYEGCPVPVHRDGGTEACGDMKLVFQSTTSGGAWCSLRCGVGHDIALNGLELIFDLDETVSVDK